MDADLNYKSLGKFIEFRSMILGGGRPKYCEENHSNCECEAENGQLCYILRKVMHGDVN